MASELCLIAQWWPSIRSRRWLIQASMGFRHSWIARGAMRVAKRATMAVRFRNAAMN